MDFSKYQNNARRTWQLVKTDHPIVYPTLGLVNEAGEVAGKIKKIFRDKDGIVGEEDRNALLFELGDVLWYLTMIADQLGIELDEIAESNIAKLTDRQARNAIGGDGDNR